MKKIIRNWLEAMDRRLNPYKPELHDKEDLTPQDYENLQQLVEGHIWETLGKLKENRKGWHNKNAIGFCDGRSFVHFKKMQELDEYHDIIEGLVDEHKKRTEKEQAEREVTPPPEIASYVP